MSWEFLVYSNRIPLLVSRFSEMHKRLLHRAPTLIQTDEKSGDIFDEITPPPNTGKLKCSDSAMGPNNRKKRVDSSLAHVLARVASVLYNWNVRQVVLGKTTKPEPS